jgi:hypothetical protein
VKNLQSSGRPLARNEEVLGMLFGLWTIIGLFLDGWAHSHQKPESFFSPWHAVLYSGFTAAALWAGWITWRRRKPGRSLFETMPPGHLASLAGFVLFGIGAIGDLIWHEIFGIEANVEALLSPTHLLLLTGGAIALSAPLRTMLRSSAVEVSWKEFLPALLSLTLLTAVGAFFLGYLSPFGTTAVEFSNATTHTHDLSHITPAIGEELRENWALGSIFLTSIVLVFPALFVRRRWKPPRGTFLFLYTFLLLLQTGLGEFKQWPLVAVGVVVGLVADVSIQHEVPAWMLGALLPLSAWSTYFLVFELQTGVGWSPELWAGVTLMAGLLGGLIGSLASGTTELERRDSFSVVDETSP